MKVISLLQPWAELVVCGAKTYETRSWHTNYKGTLLIHASGKFTREQHLLCEHEPFKSALTVELTFGAIIGMVEMGQCLKTSPLSSFITEPEWSFGDFRPNRYAWKFKNPQRLAFPMPARGQLSIWEYHGWLEKDKDLNKWVLHTAAE
jgi:hypothetical protein